MEGAPPVESVSVPAAPAPAPAGGAAPSPVQGLLQAHAEFVAWLFQSHGSLFDQNIAKIEAAGVRREHVFYGLGGLIALLLAFCGCAPLLAGIITVIYPAISSLQAAKEGGSPRWLIYWTAFGVLSVVDFFLGVVPLYFLAKTLFLVFLYLPQTQGALFLHAAVIEPVFNFVEANVLKKFL